MEVELHCDACGVMLRVPAQAAGHRARCPSCTHEFLVPPTESLLEDTVSQWIGHDVEEVFEIRDRGLESLTPQAAHADADADRRASDGRSADARSADGKSADGQAGDGGGDGDGSGALGDQDLHGRGHDSRSRRLWPMRSKPREALPAGVPLPGNERTSASGPTHPPKRVHSYDPVRTRRPNGHDGASRPDGGGAGGRAARYPTNLHVEGRIPHLRVERVDSAGVRFAFDSAWLDHEGFRASIPVRCAFSGATAREKLTARPLLFLDRSQHSRPMFDQITAAHENRQIGDQSPRDIMRNMGQIEGMPRPFTYAMPYYVSTRFAHLPLHCETRDRTSGGITCEVVIPDQLTALDWLARVNGVCGREYELLEQDVSLLHGDAWQHLSPQTRGRISVWCKLEPREVLHRYFSDADFSRRDQGLAGLAVTDRRLVYCKYHHRGQIPLDSPDAAIIARCDGRAASLTLRVGSDLSRMIKLHRHDLDDLGQALATHGQIALQVQGE